MMLITASQITEEEAKAHEIECAAVDYADIFAAEQRNAETFDGCSQIPTYSVALKPAEDIVIPLFMCSIHFVALKLSLHEGVGVDEDIFGEFPNH
jgi:hypothetical protein